MRDELFLGIMRTTYVCFWSQNS